MWIDPRYIKSNYWSDASAGFTFIAGIEDQAFLAGRIKKQDFAVASSPEKNISI